MGASTSAPAPPVSTTATSQRHHQTQLLFSPAKAGRQQQLPPMVHQRIPSVPTPPGAECGTCPSSRSASPRRLVPLSSRPEQQSFHRTNNDGHQVLLPFSPHDKTPPSSTGSETPVHELVGILPPPSPANGLGLANVVRSQQHALQQTTTVLQGESALSPTFSLSQQATPTTTCGVAHHHNHHGHAKSAMESFSPSSPLQQEEEQQQVVDQQSFQHRHKKGQMVKNFSSEELVLLTPCSFLVEEDDREGEDAVMSSYCNGKEKIEDDNRDEVWICRDAVEGNDGSHPSRHTGGADRARRHCVKDAQDTDEDHHSCSLHTDSQGGLSYSHSHSRSIHTTGLVPTKFLLNPLAPAAGDAEAKQRTTTCTPDRDPCTHPKPFALDRHLADDRCRSHCTPTLDQDDDNFSSVAPLVTMLPQPPSTTSLCDGAESSSGHEVPQQQPQRTSSPPLPTSSTPSRATRGRRQRNIRFGGITSEVHLSGHGEDLPDNIILTMDMFNTPPQRKGHCHHHRHRGGYTTSLGDTVSGGADGHSSVVGVPSLGPLIDDDETSDRWNNNDGCGGCGGNPLEGADEEEQVALMALPRQVRQRVGGAGAGGHPHHTALPASAHQPAIKSKYKMDFDVPSSSCSTSFDVEEEDDDNNEGGHHGGNGCSGGPVLSVLGVDAPRPKDPQTGDIFNPTTTAQEQNVIASTQPRSKTRTTLLMTTPSRHQSFTMNCLAPPPTPVSHTQGASPSRNTNDNGENQSSTNEKQLRFIREYHRTVSDVKNHAPVALRRR